MWNTVQRFWRVPEWWKCAEAHQDVQRYGDWVAEVGFKYFCPDYVSKIGVSVMEHNNQSYWCNCQINIPSKVKLHNPDPFDRSDPRKLCTFLLQCKLNFHDCRDHFQDNSVKVSYVLSFLKGTALECFKPGLLVDDKPAWLSDFALFIHELKLNFSTYDPIEEAEAKLEALHIQENH